MIENSYIIFESDETVFFYNELTQRLKVQLSTTAGIFFSSEELHELICTLDHNVTH